MLTRGKIFKILPATAGRNVAIKQQLAMSRSECPRIDRVRSYMAWLSTCPFRKLHPARIRVPGQNRRIMKGDVFDPLCPWNGRRRPGQVARPT
jgi:hypothetical protein